MSRTNPDGSYDWTNEHDWGTPAQQQAEIDAPDERKVTTLTRWAVLLNSEGRRYAMGRTPQTDTWEQAEAVRTWMDEESERQGLTLRYRIVRLDITISEDGSDPA